MSNKDDTLSSKKKIQCPLHEGIRECKCKIFENECGIRIETQTQIYRSNGTVIQL